MPNPTAIDVLRQVDKDRNYWYPIFEEPALTVILNALKLKATVEHPKFYDLLAEADGLSLQLEVKIPICDPVTGEDTGREDTKPWYGTPDEAYEFLYGGDDE